MQTVAANTGTLTIALLALTFSTGLIDALSFIAIGHVFTANMTGNIVFLAFAVGGAQGLSAARSAASLLSFMAGALCGGIINVRHSGWTQARLLKHASAIEAALLLVATSFAVITGSKHEITPNAVCGLIVITAVAMGLRNAVTRRAGNDHYRTHADGKGPSGNKVCILARAPGGQMQGAATQAMW